MNDQRDDNETVEPEVKRMSDNNNGKDERPMKCPYCKNVCEEGETFERDEAVELLTRMRVMTVGVGEDREAEIALFAEVDDLLIKIAEDAKTLKGEE